MTELKPFAARHGLRTRRRLWGVALTLAALAGGLLIALRSGPTDERGGAARLGQQEPRSPPWIYGNREARFTVIEYADLQCEYCRAYFPILRAWINENPQVNWQWHHLPLSIHEPAATQSARLAECAGEAAGNTAFWDTLAWIYSHPPEWNNAVARVPGASTSSLTDCLASQRPDGVIRAQVDAATGDGIAATPTLRLLDNETGAALVLSGPADGDALLSAIDWLISSHHDHDSAESH